MKKTVKKTMKHKDGKQDKALFKKMMKGEEKKMKASMKPKKGAKNGY